MPTQTLNLGILAHVDAGKTSLTERLLFDNGAIGRIGSVEAGSTQTDSGDIERLRGITIRSAVASFTAGDLQVNLIDTPGHPDFIAEVERALAVLDGAVLLLSAVEGVQAQTRVLMKSLRRLALPTLIFVNKIDRLGAREDDLLADIRRKLAPCVIPMCSVHDAGTAAARVVPRPLDRPDDRARMAEILADNDDDLLRRLVDGLVPAREDLRSLLASQTAAGLAHPVFFGSALSGHGAAELTDGIRTFLRPARNQASSAACGAVFAIERGRGGDKVAYLRLFSGELHERQRVSFRRREPGGRLTEFAGHITGLEVIGGCARTLSAGNIARLRGLPQVRVGDQLGQPDDQPADRAADRAVPSHFPSPSLETVVRAQRPGQESRLHTALMSLADEDPLIRARPAASGATSVLLYGAVQQEVIAARLERDFGVAAVFEQIRPVYFERPAGVGEASEEMGREPNRFFATIGLRVEPAAPGTGLSFTRQVELGSLPRGFHRAIEETALSALEQGLQGWEVTDCAVTLTRSGFSDAMSVAADFRGLTPLVLMLALHVAGTRVYEPCHYFEAEIPGDALSAVIAQLTALAAEVTRSAPAGASWLVAGHIPARLVQEFTMALPGLSRGEGAWWSQPGGDRLVRGSVPVRARSDGNPLNREEYLRFQRSLASGGHSA